MNEMNTWVKEDVDGANLEAHLVTAMAHFSTQDDNKDDTTWLEGFVNCFRGGGPILAAYMEQRNVEFPDHSQRDIPLRIEHDRMFKRDIPGSQFLIRVTIPHGQDENWIFNVVVNLVFSDASLYGASASNVSLNNDNREFVLPIG